MADTSDKVFVGQALELTLRAKDNDGSIINLTGKTPHFLIRAPNGVVTTDNSPTVASTAGTVMHAFTTAGMTTQGQHMAKILLSTDEIPSTRYTWTVYERWGA